MNYEPFQGTKDLPQHCAKRFDQILAWLPPALDYFLMVTPAPILSFAQENVMLPNHKVFVVPTHFTKPLSVIIPSPQAFFCSPAFHFPIVSPFFVLPVTFGLGLSSVSTGVYCSGLNRICPAALSKCPALFSFDIGSWSAV